MGVYRGLGVRQKAIINYMKGKGGVHVYFGPLVRDENLKRFYLGELQVSLDLLVKRGLVNMVKPGFYSFP